jgi:hypothetical protein
VILVTEQEKKLSPYTVQCGDGTGGRLSAVSPAEAKEMAEEMCDTHDGAKQTSRTKS